MSNKNNNLRIFGVVVVAVVVIAIFVSFGPPKMAEKSSKPDFCASCHVMQGEYTAWEHSGAHRREACVECHLPNRNKALHYIWKSIDGLKDVIVFYSGSVPERIELSDRGKKVVKDNCLRCHETTMMLVSTDRTCWNCHRRISHRYTGAIAAL